jgi:hypothetical protein
MLWTSFPVLLRSSVTVQLLEHVFQIGLDAIGKAKGKPRTQILRSRPFKAS